MKILLVAELGSTELDERVEAQKDCKEKPGRRQRPNYFYCIRNLLILISFYKSTILMKKIYYLSTCDTCKSIINELELKEKGFIFQDIKTEKITSTQLEDLKKLTGSYEALFSKIARKYKELNLSSIQLTETEIKNYILDEYTFLKRPVILVNTKIFIGNSKLVIEAVKKELL